MTNAIATNSEGHILAEGDSITSFRGEKAIFLRVTRLPEPGRSAKVLVRWDLFDSKTEMEYYSTVFNITVIEESPIADNPDIMNSPDFDLYND